MMRNIACFFIVTVFASMGQAAIRGVGELTCEKYSPVSLTKCAIVSIEGRAEGDDGMVFGNALFNTFSAAPHLLGDAIFDALQKRNYSPARVRVSPFRPAGPTSRFLVEFGREYPRNGEPSPLPASFDVFAVPLLAENLAKKAYSHEVILYVQIQTLRQQHDTTMTYELRLVSPTGQELAVYKLKTAKCDAAKLLALILDATGGLADISAKKS